MGAGKKTVAWARRSAVALAAAVVFGCAAPDAPRMEERPELGGHFEAFDVAGTFVLLDDATGARTVYDAGRAAAAFVPASTFKIFNSLAALETGVVGVDDVIPWDGVERAVAVWNQDQRMRDAFQRSTVWFYQELARRIGEDRMRALLEREGYGNRDAGGGIDRFWLTGALRITAHEQVDYLRRMRHRQVGFPDDVVETVEDLLVLERCGNYTLRGKTGWERPDGRHLGWLVGWVDAADGAVHYYAMNLESEDPAFPMGQARNRIVREILQELGVLPMTCEEPE